MKNEYALQLNNISKSYRDGEQQNNILNNVSLEVKPGQFIAIVGPSGSGKSTFLSIAGALLSPTDGSVIVGGQKLLKKQNKKLVKIRREKIGFIFQNHHLLPFLTAKEQLTFVMDMNKKNGRSKMNADEMLDDLGLSGCANKYPSKMSGGEKQRVAIARAFMNNPDVILADEPTASLDGKRGRQVVELIKKEVKKHNKAAIMVTHDERVLDLVDVVYRLENATLKRVVNQ
ncbi:ABC transporter ATP-binding protein [Defluviitalea raffinosedens]|jgi:putative ABC transport system ATP-binding protein|uniref:ABC transporter ATP-binding protein n=1 Tax=Defluviitalea raffinosedens TaxID=1450156 RepID=UPI001770A009|nr:ABC transporter ATP-binding protein [Defluviitalea raffinosedens]MBM7685698.1 putative ABC transport system ATP-binding protein [Defluviitalea raffinosedens]MBZ4667455.1 hrtA [Defluviitaleaceae bacterium]HHW66542.1 ABC transporter ATP-binding protein [Candidatus Epulonipiscium sp.]